MSDRDELIRKLQEEIERCATGKLDDRLEYDMQRISLSAFNTRLAEWDKHLAEARAQLAELETEPASPAQSAEPTPAEPQNGSGDERWDVFISYARESEAAAREVNQRLTAAGLRVWQDVNNIRHTDQWLMAIDQALRGSDRLLLLMTPEAMESRGVFIEWFFYYEQSKPIHCLLLETCDRNAALLPYQYLDWREPDKRDWDQLLRELHAPFKRPETITPSPIVGMPGSVSTEAPSPFADLLQAARDPSGAIALTQEQIKALVAHKATDLAEYRLARVAEWSQPRYALDNRFVHLTLLLDKGENEPQRWQPDDYRFNDLREVLTRVDDPALVLLGAPGSGKSTLLRRLQMDHSLDQLRSDGPAITFFVQLNGYRGEQPPHEWLSARWAESYPGLAPMDTFLQAGQTLLLLDALNEMPHNSIAEYHERVGLWRTFTQDVVLQGNRAIFSCRSLDYSASLSSKDLRVPQLEVQPLSDRQITEYLRINFGEIAELMFDEIKQGDTMEVVRSIAFLERYVLFLKKKPAIDDSVYVNEIWVLPQVRCTFRPSTERVGVGYRS